MFPINFNAKRSYDAKELLKAPLSILYLGFFIFAMNMKLREPSKIVSV